MVIYYLYMLPCISKRGKHSVYTGTTDDLWGRFHAHETGRGARYTRKKKVSLEYYEEFATRGEAMQREKEIKRMSRIRKLDLMKNGPGTKVK